MKLIRFREGTTVKPGVLHNKQYHDVSSLIREYDESFFGGDGIAQLEAALNADATRFPLVTDPVLDTPFARPSKIICIGLNYADHARETGAAIPAEPIVFFKATSALIGPNDDVLIPKGSEKTDWEVELAVVIGKKASYVSEEEAGAHIAGYCLHNDLSERAFQLERGGQWVKGKSCDTFAPMGPFLATPNELGDVDNLRLWLSVNGQTMQDGSTANLIFRVPFLVSYLSQFMTLLPGDVISTGTPAGVGLGMKPALYLQPGDVVELGIDGLGTQRQNVKAYAAD